MAAFVLVPSAGAHLVRAPDHPRKSALENRVAALEESLAHARYVCRHGGGEHGRWGCWAASSVIRPNGQGWLRRLHREADRALWAQRVASIGDYAVAVRVVERYFGPQPFLWACPESEGGFGEWVWNGGYPLSRYPSKPAGSSGAGGWLQFLPGTFESVIADAIARARGLGMPVPSSAYAWTSPIGQALAGVEMLRDGRIGEWHGSTC